MEYLALYRKYRPKTFEEVVGQDHIIKTLKNQVEKKEISHAYLLNGTRGTGKTSTAKILSKAINCLNSINGSPCLKCSVCKALEDPSNLDILEIDAASNNRVDEIRDLREKIKYPPVSGKYKVYIIDEVHMLTESAFNALLKTLEEPPSHAVFILATTEVHKLPATILSRVMRFDFKLVSIDNLVKLLKKIFKEENITADEESLKAMALAGEGSVRDTLSVADVCASFSGGHITYNSVLEALGTTTKDILYSLADAIIEKNSGALLTSINNLFIQGKNLGVLTRDLIGYFRDLLIIKTVKNASDMLLVPNELYIKMQEQSIKVKEDRLLFFMQTLTAMESELKYAANERLFFETATLSCINETSILENLSKRLELLEKGIVLPAKEKIVKEIVKEKEPTIKEEVKVAKSETITEKPKNIEVNVGRIWGKFLISLNAQTYPVLYTAVIDASPLKIEDDKFILEVDNAISLNTLNRPEHKNLVEAFLKSEQIDAKLEIVLKKDETKEGDHENMLKEKFGDLLKVIK